MDIKVSIPAFKKDVVVSVPDGTDLKTSFNEASSFVQTLAANNQIRDKEMGINPPHATHEIVKEKNGDYRLRRFRFSAI